MKSGGGTKAINYSLKVAREVGIKNLTLASLSKNTCKTCALGMGGQQGGMKNEEGHFPEVCKKSFQAQLTDIQPAIKEELFFLNEIKDFQKMSGRELERLGRLNTPLYKAKNSNSYRPISWEKAFEMTIEKLKKVDPDRTFFYSSGRSSNEAGFLLQLFARVFGTNNINNCSYYCHQASGVALTSMIGTSTATIQLEDISQTDLIFVIGANPASNHPRFMRELMLCRRRGGQVIVINPAKELGLVKFAVPSDVKSMAENGSEIASEYLQPNIGGDISLFKGIAKILIEKNNFDKTFIENYTLDFENYKKHLEELSWEELLNTSGITKTEMEKVATIYENSKNVVFAWSMGMTHHEHGVENIENIINLALLRGMIGRKYSGLLPLRGHSNVQGMGSIGVTPMLKDKVFKNLQDYMKIELPTKEGMDTMACMKASNNNEVDIAFILGGNLYASNPDSKFAEKALNKIDFKVFLTTTLNQGHFFGVEQESLVLPVAARDEEKQKTTQESMFSFVRLSDGGIVRLDNVKSEVDIISELAIGVLGNEPINFSEFKTHSNIRKAIAKVIPGLEELENIDKTLKEFHIPNRTIHTPEFLTETKKATFKVTSTPKLKGVGENEFRMMTIRSEGQFNSIVYDEEDLYRGQKSRWVVLMNKDDIVKYGFKENEKVTLTSSVGKMKNVVVKEYNIPKGNIMTYYPEANVLITTEVDKRSKTPAFKSTVVSIVKSNFS